MYWGNVQLLHLKKLARLLAKEGIVIRKQSGKSHFKKYDCLDIWYDMSVHFGVERGFPSVERYHMTLPTAIMHSILTLNKVKIYYRERKEDAFSYAASTEAKNT